MTKLFTISIAALVSAVSLTTAAAAQESFRFRDLDLTTARGVQTLQNRIANAAARSCASEMTTGSRTTGGVGACERDFRRSALEALPTAQREQVHVTLSADSLVRAR